MRLFSCEYNEGENLMKVMILQVGDIHLLEDKNSIVQRMSKIYEAVRNIALEVEQIFLVVNGDIAFSATEKQYEKAMILLDYLIQNLKEYTSKSVSCVIVPGNHDCYHKEETVKLRERLLKSIYENPDVDNAIIEQCCEVQKNYFIFEEMYQDGEIIFSDKLLKIKEFKIAGFNIIFNCYNTSWLSKKYEQPGCLYYPIEKYINTLKENKADTVISIFHHPYNWHNPESGRNFNKYIELNSDLVLTGHEHEASKKIHDDLSGNITEYIECGILQDTEDYENSSFNIIILDLEKHNQKIINFKWDEKFYNTNSDTEWITYKRAAKLHKNIFEINDSFRDVISDPGATYLHPRKQKLTLEDIYIYPDLIKIGEWGDEDTSEKFNKKLINKRISAEILNTLSPSNNYILLLGDEETGKTALCKMLLKNYCKLTYVPIYIDGSSIKDSDIDKFQKLVKQSFSDQYSSDTLEQFNQLEKNKKILIIDNYDNVRLNPKFLANLTNDICNIYDNVIITGNELLQIEEILSRKHTITLFKNFKKYQIREFGHLLRDKLISKWNTLGTDKYTLDSELIRVNDASQKIVNSIIGKNYVPSYPIFILTILQTTEMGNPHDLKDSSYGYYYQFLITQALSKINMKNDEIDAYYNYIILLANSFYEKGIQEISRDEFIDFHKWFCYDEFKVSSSFVNFINFDILVNNLLKVSILEQNNDTYKFKYRYVFYFSVAKYLSDNLSSEDIKAKIRIMCKNLHVQENANIFMFIIHHSKDSFIINEILLNAKAIFSEVEPIEFEKDITAFNNLLDEVPKLILEDKSVKEFREQQLAKKDECEDSNSTSDEIDFNITSKQNDFGIAKSEVAVAKENIAELDTFSRINIAFKMMQLIGQILKNYWGSLNAKTRMQLGEATYLTGLRALNSFFIALSENNEYIVDTIQEFIKKEGVEEDNEVEKIAKNILFRFSSELSYGFIKKISGVIGYEKLSETFKDILVDNNTVAVNIVDTSIKLDFYREFPYDEMRELLKRVDKNILPRVLLKSLVVNYLYMFETSYKDKARICDLVDISIKSQIIIDKTSSNKK